MTDTARGETGLAQPRASQRSEAADLTNLRLKVLALSAENERLRNTVSFQLGGAILRLRSLDGLRHFPGEIARLVQLSRQRRGRLKDGEETPKSLEERLRRIVARAFDTSAEEIEEAVRHEGGSPVVQATLLTGLGNIIRPLDPAKALILSRRAAAVASTPQNNIALANLLVDAGAVEEPLEIYRRLRSKRTPMPFRSNQRMALLEGMVRVQRGGLEIPPRARGERSAGGSPGLLYVAASSFPYHTTGYTSRTQAVLKALVDAGERVHAVTRPGYPNDRNDVHLMQSDAVQFVNGVTYTRLTGPQSNSTPFDHYCEQASEALSQMIDKTRPTVVHAASNYLNAMPALIAARRAGLPFAYEVRGLWELTQAAKDPLFEASERFRWQREQETRVASEADLVFTISQGLRAELVERGVDAEKIVIVPNCVDSEVFAPRRMDKALRDELLIGQSKVLGFIGSMTAYEGLVDLISAMAELRRQGLDVCALLVGDGPAAQEVREAARSLGVERHLIMPGRVSHAEVARWYSLMDVAVYPRRPSRVTELVPPLKPLEAMAAGIPVVASNVSAIRETVQHGYNGLLFERGDVDDLVEQLKQALTDRRRARVLAKQARRHVQDAFSWNAAAAKIVNAYKERLNYDGAPQSRVVSSARASV